jgi:hypothetical protein
MIEKLGLYPITSMTTLSRSEKQLLLDAGIVLCRDIIERPGLLKQFHVSEARAGNMLNEAQLLCEKLSGKNRQNNE